MKFSFSDAFLKTYPHHQVAFGILKNVDIFGPNEASEKILTDIYPKVKETFKNVDLPSLLTSIPYIQLEKQINAGDRFGFPYDQIQRVLDGKSIHNINNVVNTYMTYELMSNLSFSSYDVDTLDEVNITLAKDNETMILLGGKKTAIPVGDLIFRDGQGIFYSFSKGYADRTKITKQTKNVLYTIDAPEGIKRADVDKNIKALCKEFGSDHYFILDKDTPLLTE